MPGSCGGFIWVTGEDLRDATDAGLAARLSASGPLHMNGLQGNGIWRVKPNNAPPLESYFIEYIDEFADSVARGDLGDIAILRACTPRPDLYPSSPPKPPPGAPPIRHGRPPGGEPPGGRPPGGCSPNLLRDVNTGECVPGCQRPNIQVNGKCCSVATLAANAACSNSNCPSGQTAIGPSISAATIAESMAARPAHKPAAAASSSTDSVNRRNLRRPIALPAIWQAEQAVASPVR